MTTPTNREELRAMLLPAVAGKIACEPECAGYPRGCGCAADAVDALLSALDETGIALVPKEATEEMVDEHATECAGDVDEASPKRIMDCWRAMLAASPYAQEEPK